MQRAVRQLKLEIATLGVASLFLSPVRAAGKQAEKPGAEATVKALAKPVVNEDRDRLVDQAALQAQAEAIKKLRELLKRYTGSVQEPLLLGRLAEAYQQEAAIKFRVAHGRAHRSGKAVDLVDFKKSIKSSVSNLDTLIAKFPNFENIEEAWFLRGKAFEEVEDKANARKNYLHLVKHWPDALQAPAAYMSLANFAIDENKHQEAVGYLEQVEKRPNDPQYPFALYKLGWSHYNLKNIPAALGYLERHIGWYAARIKNTEGTPDPTDVAMRDNSIIETALFYVEGIERRQADYSSEAAVPYFRKIDRGPVLGRVLTRFAKLLRAHGKEAELLSLKNLVLKEEIERQESVEIVMTWFEDRLNKRKYPELVPIAQDVETIAKANPKTFRSWESYAKAVDMIIKTSEELQKLVIKNKAATEVAVLSNALAGLYMSVTRLVDPKDPRIPGVHYNLAETLFEIKDFDGATEHYRWVVDNWRDSSSFDLENTSLRAIAARYEVLRGAKLVTEALDARSLKSSDRSSVDPRLEEWVAWIDAHEDRFSGKRKTRDESFENFEFEANRALYAQMQTKRAVERMLDFAKRVPDSKFAVGSASLALDSYVLTNDWKQTHELARDLNEQKAWKGGEFSTRLAKVEADSWFKILEGKVDSKNMDEALAAARACLERYQGSERYPDCLLMTGKIELRLNREERAEEYFSRLIKERGDSEAANWALQERARIHERNYRFELALNDYDAVLMKGGAPKEVSSRLIPLAWLAGRDEALKGYLDRKALCEEDDAKALCDRMEALLLLRDPTYRASDATIRNGLEILGGMRKKPDANRALWALVGLNDNAKLGFKDRLDLLNHLSSNWDRLDAPLQFQLQSRMIDAVRTALAQNRRILVTSFPLKPEKRAISKRMDMVKELESETVRLVKLPWARLRTEILGELALAYTDIGDGLRSLPVPKDFSTADAEEYKQTLQSLTLPFDEKAVELRTKAFEVASESAVEDATFLPLSELYLKDNPSKTAQLAAFRKPAVAKPMEAPKAPGFERFERLLPSGRWFKFDPKSFAALRFSDEDERARLLLWTWHKALEKGEGHALSFLLAEAKRTKVLNDLDLGVMAFLSLERIGARAEGLVALEKVRSKADAETRGALSLELVEAYFRSGAKERVQRVLDDLARDVEKKENVYGRLSRDDKKTLTQAEGWVKGRAEGAQVTSLQEGARVGP